MLILGINLIPIIISNTVDYTTHIGGFVTGGLMVVWFHFGKEGESNRMGTVIKFGAAVLIGAIIVSCIALIYGLPDKNNAYKALNDGIDVMCSPVS
jgi:membrane associated rhomboid family serine protease